MSKPLVLCAMGLLTLLGCGGSAARKASWLDNGVTAHRGDSAAHPENTLEAFRSAIEAGADWIELDVWRTRDGKLAVIHDPTTGRVAAEDVRVEEVTYDELARVDVAQGHRQRHGATASQVPPVHPPLLSDALALVKTQRRTRMSIQPKCDCVAQAMQVVKRMGATPWVGFNDASLDKMREVKRLAPSVPVFWDRGPDTDLAADIRTALEEGFEALVVHHTALDAAAIGQIHDAALRAGAWTVNDPGEMRRLLDAGVDRIYTDRPAMLLRLRQRR